jgi:hypothetical protein
LLTIISSSANLADNNITINILQKKQLTNMDQVIDEFDKWIVLIIENLLFDTIEETSINLNVNCLK